MFLVSIAILSLIIALIRKGSFANIIHSGLKAPYLFILSLLLFIGLEVGTNAQISTITDWSYYIMLGAYLTLLLAIILNLNMWMFVLLLGSLANFIVIFINGGKMPVSLDALTTAGLTESFVENSSTLALASSTTHFPFLGAIIPLPLPGALAEVISPGTILIGLGLFMIIQNIMTGVAYEDEVDDGDDVQDFEETFSKKRSSKKENSDTQDTALYDEDDEINEEEFGKDYTIGNININDLDDLDEEADDTALGLEPNENEEQEIGTNAEQSDGNLLETSQPDLNNPEIAESDDDVVDALGDEDTDGFFDEDTSDDEIEIADEPSDEDEDIEGEDASEYEDEEPYAEDEQEDNDYQEGDDDLTDDLTGENDPSTEDEYEYDPRDTDELTLSTEALREAQDVIENEIPAQQEILEQQKLSDEDDEPLEVDTDSPFIIVDGRIVENPYYKFRKGTKKETTEDATPIPEGIYVMKSRKPSSSGRPSFAPPTHRTQTKAPADTKITDEENGYETVEMKIGDVQIKFWKKDNEDEDQ